MTNKEIKALISLLDDPEVAPAIQDKIQHLGESIIPFLEESWEETLDPQQQQRLVQLVVTLSPREGQGRKWKRMRRMPRGMSRIDINAD